MRRLLSILYVILSVFIFASCKDENAFMPADDDQPCYSILVSAPNNATRAYYEESGEDISVKWEKGDVLYVGNNQFVYKEDKVDNSALFVLYGELQGSDRTVKFGANESGVQIQEKNNKCHEVLVGDATGYNFSNPTTPISLLPETGKSLLHIQAKSPAMFMGKSMLKIKGLATEDYTIQLGTDPKLVFADVNEQLDIYVTVPTGSISSGKTLKFYFYAYDENTPDDLYHGDEYHYYMKCNASVQIENDKVVKLPLPGKPTHTALQLGLPSGTKWATMNVGATKEEEPGEYFAWGEVATKQSYNSSSYNNNVADLLNGNNLADKYDAANQNWGGDWVMPTKDEAQELVSCTWTNATKDGVSGYNITNGTKSIFLPSGGYMYGSELNDSEWLYYWVSTGVDGNNDVAYSLYLNSRDMTNQDNTLKAALSEGGARVTGRLVRPVRKSN